MVRRRCSACSGRPGFCLFSKGKKRRAIEKRIYFEVIKSKQEINRQDVLGVVD